MPMRRISEGLMIIGIVFVATMVALASINSHAGPHSPAIISGILSLAAFIVGGILKILSKLEEITLTANTNQALNEEFHDKITKCAEAIEGIHEDVKSVSCKAEKKIQVEDKDA